MSKSTTTLDTHLAQHDAAARQEHGLEVLPAETADEAAFLKLTKIAELVTEHIDHISKHEDAFQEATLEPRLLIGQQISSAQEIFALSADQVMAKARDAKSIVTGVTIEQGPAEMPSFTAWLSKNLPELKRPHAYKLVAAWRSLDLPADAKLPRIRDKVNDLRHHAGKNNLPMPSINALAKSGKPKILPLPAPPLPATPLEDAREFFTAWREEGERLIQEGHLEALDKRALADLKEFQGWLRDRLNARLK